jgi:hypothetical protein
MPNPKITLRIPAKARKAGITTKRGINKLLRQSAGYDLNTLLSSAVEDALFQKQVSARVSR